ncbi:MAG: sulfurtransferase [Polyangiaceae bacterium]|nr:sulfurtransferase [Polyangiaceae bacterium]
MKPLVSAHELARLDAVHWLDARPSADAYAAGHLPGARHASLEEDLSSARVPGHDPAHGGRHPLPPPEWFGRKLDAWGVALTDTVVVYDDESGANAAARAYWMLRALGHERVAVLDGGLASARRAGLALTSEVPRSSAAPSPSPERKWRRPTVAIDDVEAYAATPGWKVLDVRSPERFRGEAEPIDPVAGHIPGAVNLFFRENLREDGTFKSRDELARLYTRILGGVPPERLVVHCGSGVTACHTLLALDVAGLPGAALYVGSWSEWCRSGRPRAKGP